VVLPWFELTFDGKLGKSEAQKAMFISYLLCMLSSKKRLLHGGLFLALLLLEQCHAEQ